MTTERELLFLDTETTGLDPYTHEVWEIGWAVGLDDAVESVMVPHNLATADPAALDLNGYYKRPFISVDESADVRLKKIAEGKVLVGCNPAFDAAFLRARWGSAPWFYRMIDVEVLAMAKLGWDRPKGLKDIHTELTERGHYVPEPNHTAKADVYATRGAYRILVSL